MRVHPLFLLLPLLALPAHAKPVRQPVTYEAGGRSFEGVLLYDDSVKSPRPGLLLAPNWLGVTEPNLAQAATVAGREYVVLVADLYGKDARPKNKEEAGAAAGALKADRQVLRERTLAALAALRKRTADPKVPLDARRIGAIGFCFGGTAVVELAKAGADVAAVVSLHGGLDAPAPTEKTPKARILALHGADDPTVPQASLQAFKEDLRRAKADWTLVEFGGAVHSFTDPDANVPGRSLYHPQVARRAFEMMRDFFDESFSR